MTGLLSTLNCHHFEYLHCLGKYVQAALQETGQLAEDWTKSNGYPKP